MKLNSSATQIEHRDERVGRVESERSTSNHPKALVGPLDNPIGQALPNVGEHTLVPTENSIRRFKCRPAVTSDRRTVVSVRIALLRLLDVDAWLASVRRTSDRRVGVGGPLMPAGCVVVRPRGDGSCGAVRRRAE